MIALTAATLACGAAASLARPSSLNDSWPGVYLADGDDQGLKGQAAQTAPLQGETSRSAAIKGGVNEDTLKGGVQKEGSALTMPSRLKLTAQQYKQAVSQYKSDISQFYSHVEGYQVAVKALKRLIGECNEDQAQYNEQVKKNQLNINALQIPAAIVAVPKPPDIPPELPPPRACCVRCLQTGQCGIHLGTGAVGGLGANAQPGTARIDAMRINEAQGKAAKTQAQLSAATAAGQAADAVVMNFAEVEKRSQDISDQFGRLKKEYDVLRIEREMLAGSQPGSLPDRGRP